MKFFCLEDAMTFSQQRQWLRNGHLIASVLLGTFIHSPLREAPAFIAIMQFLVFPAIAASGVWMWQQARLARSLKVRPS
jgi:hypothetical protein